jgi:hypothetical protein
MTTMATSNPTIKSETVPINERFFRYFQHEITGLSFPLSRNPLHRRFVQNEMKMNYLTDLPS